MLATYVLSSPITRCTHNTLSLNIRQFTRDHVLDEHGTVIHLDSLPSHVKIKKVSWFLYFTELVSILFELL